MFSQKAKKRLSKMRNNRRDIVDVRKRFINNKTYHNRLKWYTYFSFKERESRLSSFHKSIGYRNQRLTCAFCEHCRYMFQYDEEGRYFCFQDVDEPPIFDGPMCFRDYRYKGDGNTPIINEMSANVKWERFYDIREVSPCGICDKYKARRKDEKMRNVPQTESDLYK